MHDLLEHMRRREGGCGETSCSFARVLRHLALGKLGVDDVRVLLPFVLLHPHLHTRVSQLS